MVPTAVERRVARSPSIARGGPQDRRKVKEGRVLVPDALQKGWLAFQCGTDRRRLAPIPDDWRDLTDDELLDLLHRADVRPRARRLIE